MAILPGRGGTVSKLGVFLDPVADKIMVAAVIVMLIHNDHISGLACDSRRW
jgi:cardiolipin synthase (CMP-forming)